MTLRFSKPAKYFWSAGFPNANSLLLKDNLLGNELVLLIILMEKYRERQGTGNFLFPQHASSSKEGQDISHLHACKRSDPANIPLKHFTLRLTQAWRAEQL